jgi:hypothetical protein
VSASSISRLRDLCLAPERVDAAVTVGGLASAPSLPARDSDFSLGDLLVPAEAA